MKAFIDIETGGFSMTKNGVCEIAMVITTDNCIPVQQLHSLIKPYYREGGNELVSYKEDAMKINGILVQDLEEKGRNIEEVLKDLLELKHYYVDHELNFVGHNSTAFDIPRVNYLLTRFLGYTLDNHRQEDTMILAKNRLNLSSYSLENLCNHFGIANEKAHSALSDVFATIELYKKLNNII